MGTHLKFSKKLILAKKIIKCSNYESAQSIPQKIKKMKKMLRINKKVMNFLNKIIKGRELSCQPKYYNTILKIYSTNLNPRICPKFF